MAKSGDTRPDKGDGSTGGGGEREFARTVHDQQHTGNHERPGRARGAGPDGSTGSDRHGGTRHGAGNVEPENPGRGKDGFRKVDESAQEEAAEERAHDKGYD